MAVLCPFSSSCASILLLTCLTLVSPLTALPSRLRIDPPGSSPKSRNLDRSGRLAKVDLDLPFNFNNKAVYTMWISPHGFVNLEPPMEGAPSYPFNTTVRNLKQLRRKVLAAFLARVDMSNSQAVRYRLVSRNDNSNDCRMRNVMTRLDKEIQILFPENKGFATEQMLVVNWERVGQRGKSERNTFETAILTNGRNSFVIINIVDIQWLKSSGDPPSQVALSGDGFVYELPVSKSTSFEPLRQDSNVATPGMWVLKTGNLDLPGEIKSPKTEYSRASEEQRKDKLQEIRDSLGFGKDGTDPCETPASSSQPTVTKSGRTSRPSPTTPIPTTTATERTRPSTSTRAAKIPESTTTSFKAPLAFRARTCVDLRCQYGCKDVNGEACCSCRPGLFGDGTTCFNLETARIYISGDVSVSVGRFPRSKGQLVLQGRTSRDANRGYVRFEGNKEATSIAQILVPLFVTPIWYAARPEGAGMNAIQLSGMKLTRRSNVDIKDFGQFAIVQTVEKVGKDGRGRWDTSITGRLDDRALLPAPVENVKIQHLTMKFLRPGIITASWNTDVKAGDQTYNVKWTEEITYNPACPTLNIPRTFTLYTKGLYAARIQPTAAYYLSDAVVREGRPDTNPCAYPEVKCPGRKEICVVTSPSTHDCRCEAGYEMRPRTCVDINECLTGRARCDKNAICVNRPGTYSCQCKPGFQGDGFRCERVDAICDRCDRVGGECVPVSKGRLGCRCRTGFEGDGFTCRKKETEMQCREKCHYYAVCDRGRCRCKPGLSGDGKRCFECSVAEGPRCHANAACFFDDKMYYYRCKCREGFRGDGINTCVGKDFDCRLCDRNADCVNGEFCRCRSGFRDMSGNGQYCTRECRQKCHQKATCDTDGRCKCGPDYRGNGTHCYYDCNLCDANADCRPQTGCACRANFRGDGRVCNIDHECIRDTDCGPNGVCQGVPLAGVTRAIRRQCACKKGFLREGGTCTKLKLKLKILPSEAIVANEGDQIVLKCKIEDGSLLVGSLIWSKDKSSSLRVGIRTNIDSEQRVKQLIILEARPEDSGTYICQGDRAMVTSYLNVKPNPCNRKCHQFGYCERTEGQCKCHVGYRGDGINSCIREVCSKFPEMCGRNSRCVKDACVCNPGYKKVNKECKEIEDCRTLKNCHKDGECVNKGIMYACRCRNGYIGDGMTKCTKIKLGCNLINRCVANAECVLPGKLKKYICRCMEGYFGHGELKCQKRYDCDKTPAPCGPKSKCRKELRYDDRSQAKVTVGICECEAGYSKIGEFCYKKESVNTSLFMSQGSLIYKVPVVTTDQQKPSIWLPNSVYGFSTIVIALAADCNERRVYWTSRNRGPSIVSAPEKNPSARRVVLKNAGQIEGLAVDWISGNVFFTNPSARDPTIGVVTRDGTQTRTLIRIGLRLPRAIAVDPMNGKMYWSDWDRTNPRIESANMDGTERKIVAEKLQGLPNGLVFDFQQRRLCWILADLMTGTLNSTAIYCIRPDVEPLPTRVFFERSGRPFALTYNAPKFYFTDWNKLRLQAIDGETRTVMPPMPRTSSSKLYGLTVLQPMCPAGSNMCSRRDNNYGGCRYLCLPLPFGARVCKCPQHLKDCKPSI